MREIILLVILTIGLVLSTSCNRPDTDITVPPQAAINVSPDTLLTTTHIRFDCSKSLAGNVKDEIYYRWDWNNDGIWDEEYSSDPMFVHRFYSKGTHKSLLEALNSSGLTDTCSITVSVDQDYSNPRALFQVNPEYGNRITEFTFDATSSKDDEDSLDQLQFKWDWEGDGIWDTGFSSKSVVKHTFFETGDFQPTMEIRDPQGMSSLYNINLEVNQINPNLHMEFSWDPLHPLQEDTVLFDASLTINPDDPDNELLYYWKFDLGSPLKLGEWLGPFHEPFIEQVFQMEHAYNVTLKVVDENSLEKSLDQAVRVFHLNRPPIPIFKIGSKRGNLTTQFYLDAWPTYDIEDLPTALKIRWDFEGDESWDTEFSNEKYYYHKFTNPGVYQIVMEAMDTEGLKDTTSTYVTVTAGTNETGLIIDRRFDAEEFYPTVKIGDQWWMAKNMYYEPGLISHKIDTLRSHCYYSDDIPWHLQRNICTTYGRLYTAYSAADMKMWEGAKGICPNGWHLPTRKEWETLIYTIGGYSSASELLLGGSTDFNALYAGWGHEILVQEAGEFSYKAWEFIGLGSITYFWSSTPLKPSPPGCGHWNIALLKGKDQIYKGFSGNANFLSVRCIKNE